MSSKKPSNNNSDGMKKNKLNPLLNRDKKDIEGLIKSAMQDYLVQHSNTRVEKAKNIDALVTLVSEFLSAFIIIGYDVNRGPVNLIHAKSQMDADALSAAINKFILNSISKAGE